VASGRPTRQRPSRGVRGATPRVSNGLQGATPQVSRARPLPAGQSLFTPGASAARAATERRSARVLLFLHQLPAWTAPVALAVLLVAGLAVRGPGGAAALLGVAAVLGWLASISWPRLSAGGRLGRLATLALALGLAIWQATR
jgi:hypothetical protein